MLTCCVLRDALERACIAFSEVLNGYLLADLVRPRNRLWTMLAIPPVRNPSGAFHALRSRNSKEIDRDGKPRPKPISRGPPFAGARKKARKCRLHLLLLRSRSTNQARLRRGRRQRAINAGPIWPPSRLGGHLGVATFNARHRQ